MTIAATDFRMRHGIGIPIHSVNGYQAGISFAGYDIEQSADAKAAVELIAIYAFNKFTHLRIATAERPKILTPRQREILSWTAIGKTAWDIAQILGISEDTVNKQVGSAIVRLSASNRTHAVVEAIRRKEIDL
jgi:LuxR family quorum sensing-dependent transcriptional regulator